MATTLRREGGCWENRFVPPSAAELVEGVTRSLRPSVSLVRKSLVAAGDVHERVQWQGVWKWTLVYEHAALLGRAWAFLVLEPGRPRLCIPMPEEALTDPLARRFSREVRESLAQAAIVNGARWPVWTLESKAQATELMSLCEFKAVAAHAAQPTREIAAPKRGRRMQTTR